MRRGAGRPLHDFTAADPLELWNDHQREMRIYLLPLLARLSKANPLRPRAGDVYRAFPTIPADPAAVARVQALLPDLEAPSPQDREAASKRIAALGDPGVLALLRTDRSALAPEQGARVDALIAANSTLREPASWVRDIYFLTDCLAYADDPAVRVAALNAVRVVAGDEVLFDPSADESLRESAALEIRRLLEVAAKLPPVR